MKTNTYFVSVDFSACSYNALQYATMLARFSEGKVKLCHVVDLEEVPESDNPVVVSFALERLLKKAQQKMKSLIEIISLEGVTVDEVIVMGNVRYELMKQIDKIKPQVIVIGRNLDTLPRKRGLVAYITRNTKVPVLVVPGSHNPKVPNRAVLATDMRPGKEAQLAPFFDMVKKMPHDLSILNITSPFSVNGKDSEHWIATLNSTYGINAKFLHQENMDVVNGVVDFIRSHDVDLLCTVRHKPGFLDKLFRRSVSNQLTNRVEVPVLVLTE